ncbi:MAG: polyprenyl synthetase family protein [Candidatus Nitrosocaldaceae archaeon]
MCKVDALRYFDNYITRFDNELEKELELYSWSQFYEPLKYALANGKRLRPLLLILSAESVGGKSEDLYNAAVAVELLHTESIIHDDIIDKESKRRGNIPFYKKYGYDFSILTADFVLGMILHVVAKIDNARAARELANAALLMSEGEALDIMEGRIITFDDYINMIELKTSSLFEVSAKVGAILGGGDENAIEKLAMFGKYIGLAYQIHDDMNDWHKEYKLFNILLDSSKQKEEFFVTMNKYYENYIIKAYDALKYINDNSRLERLIELTRSDYKKMR